VGAHKALLHPPMAWIDLALTISDRFDQIFSSYTVQKVCCAGSPNPKP